MSKKYRRLQIVKHALQYYLQREAPEADKVQEKSLLKIIEEEIETFKSRHRIK